MEEIRDAAVLGSAEAQYYLGHRYEKGEWGLPEVDRARRYFRLCAAQGISVCQYRLGRLLLEEADRPERDYLEALAWFQLAGDQNLNEAKDVAAKELAALTPSQAKWVNSLKAQLMHR